MARNNVDIIDWKIENFSRWNQTLHGKCMTSPEAIFDDIIITMKLYPKVTSGKQTRMVVQLTILKITDTDDLFFGEFLFIGSDGSTLSSHEVIFYTDEEDFNIPLGPKFEEVILNQSDHTDQLTLRLRGRREYCSNWDYYEFINIFTKIDVFQVNLEIDPSNLVGDLTLSTIEYIHDEHYTELDLKMKEINEDEKIAMALNDYTSDKFKYSVQTHLSLISKAGSLLRFERNEHLFHQEEFWTFSDSLSEKELSENVIILHLKFTSGKVSSSLVRLHYDKIKIVPNCCLSGQENSKHMLSEEHLLSEELKCLYRDRDFSDLQLKCGGAFIPVHKNILSARSPVFKTMLTSDMKEAGIVEIEDMDAASLSQFLSFIYTGTVGEDLKVDSAFKLYRAADKYQVPSLKKICSDFLIANVSASNVYDVLSLGDQYQDDELISEAQKFTEEDMR